MIKPSSKLLLLSEKNVRSLLACCWHSYGKPSSKFKSWKSHEAMQCHDKTQTLWEEHTKSLNSINSQQGCSLLSPLFLLLLDAFEVFFVPMFCWKFCCSVCDSDFLLPSSLSSLLLSMCGSFTSIHHLQPRQTGNFNILRTHNEFQTIQHDGNLR